MRFIKLQFLTRVHSESHHWVSDTVVPAIPGERSPARSVSKRKATKRLVSDDERSDRASDDSFNLEDDSDDDLGASESEFEPDSPAKRKGAKKKAASTRSPKRASAKVSTVKKQANLKPIGKRLTPKTVSRKSKSNTAGGSSSSKTLAGRPLLKPKLKMMAIPKGDGASKPRTPLNPAGAPRFRSGISRNQRVPRLHKYLSQD